MHPKAVRITEVGWRFYADEHVKLGTLRCAINGHAVYRLTRAVDERLMREPA